VRGAGGLGCGRTGYNPPPMAGERLKLMVQNRAVLGSAESRRLRRQGLIPGILYGRETPIPITIGERDLRHALTGPGGANAVLDVVVEDGETHSSVLKDYQQHPVRGNIVHVDLQEVRLDRPIHATVPLHLVGEAAGTKEGGVLSQAVMEVTVEALPMAVPSMLELDISELHVNEYARLDQLVMPEGVAILDDLETIAATVTPPSRLVEEGEGEGAAAPTGETEAGADEPAADEAPAESDSSEE
jgi:large subunit ribosomal protein L25